MARPKRTPSPPPAPSPTPMPHPAPTATQAGRWSGNRHAALENLQRELDRLQADLPGHLTMAQRARKRPPKPKAVSRLGTGGLGVSYITPVGGAEERIAKALRFLRLIPGGTEVSLKAYQHRAGIAGVFRHETAHQLLRAQRVPQRGEDVIRKVQLPHDVPPRQFYGVVEQVGRAEKTPTREQRRRLSQMRQRVMFGRQRRRGRGK